MRPFAFESVNSTDRAVTAASAIPDAPASAVQFLAGGTTLIDLMKLDVMRPSRVIDINAIGETALGRIEASDKELRLGALVRMSDAAGHPALTKDYPAIAQSL